MERRDAARKDEEVRKAENDQWHNRRWVSEYGEHEQSFNMERQVAAHKDEEVRGAENNQHCNRRHLNPETRSEEQSVDTFR